MTPARPVHPVPTARQGGARPRHLLRQRLGLPLLVGGAGVGTLALLGTLSPYEAGHYPTCPFLALTGFFCPGCGSLRALHDLAHLDVGSALARNPLAVAAAAGLLVAYVVWVRRVVRSEPRHWLAPPQALYALLAVVVGFWVLRNVPGWTWLSPA